MMGKIIGVAAVGLLQFTIWILLSLAIFVGVKGYMMSSYSEKMAQQTQVTSVMSAQGGTQISEEDMAKIQDEVGDTTKIFNSISERIIPILFYFVIFFLGGVS